MFAVLIVLIVNPVIVLVLVAMLVLISTPLGDPGSSALRSSDSTTHYLSYDGNACSLGQDSICHSPPSGKSQAQELPPRLVNRCTSSSVGSCPPYLSRLAKNRCP